MVFRFRRAKLAFIPQDRGEHGFLVDAADHVIPLAALLAVGVQERIAAVDDHFLARCLQALHDHCQAFQDLFLRMHIVDVTVVHEEAVNVLLQQSRRDIIQHEILPALLGNVHPHFLFPVLIRTQGQILVLVIVIPEIFQGADVDIREDFVSLAPESVQFFLWIILGVDYHDLIVRKLLNVLADTQEHAVWILECRCLFCPGNSGAARQYDQNNRTDNRDGPFALVLHILFSSIRPSAG